LLGALRDACVYLPEYELKFVQKNFSWLSDVVRPKLMRTFDIGRMSVRKRADGLYELKLNSKKVVSKLIEDAGVNKRPIDTPPIILNQPLPKLAWYVQAFTMRRVIRAEAGLGFGNHGRDEACSLLCARCFYDKVLQIRNEKR
jgi:hypothetical protein